MNDRTESLLEALHAALPIGRATPASAADLSRVLGVSTRTIRELAGELIDRGIPVGSTCSSDRAGYFECWEREDFELAMQNLRPRALAILKRWSALKRAAAVKLGEPTALRLFELKEATA
jgi:DNA-binding Lrp family transcriptional regulator